MRFIIFYTLKKGICYTYRNVTTHLEKSVSFTLIQRLYTLNQLKWRFFASWVSTNERKVWVISHCYELQIIFSELIRTIVEMPGYSRPVVLRSCAVKDG